MIRFEYALIVATATAAATLAYSPAEPYAAIITVLLPPVFVLAWSGLRGATRGGGWAAVIGTGIFLGLAALFYTLLLAYAAFTLAIMALLLARGPQTCGAAAAAARHRRHLRCHLADRLGTVSAGGVQRSNPPIPAPHSTICRPRARSSSSRCCTSRSSARCACSARCGWSGAPAPRRRAARAGRRGARRLRVVAAVDADHAGRHHPAVVPAAAHADRAAHRGRRVRLHRSDPRGGRAGHGPRTQNASSRWPPRSARSAR